MAERAEGRRARKHNAARPDSPSGGVVVPSVQGAALLEGLTGRESAVLALIMDGLNNREMGRALGISTRTVEFHRANMMQKLQVRNVVELMRVVLERR